MLLEIEERTYYRPAKGQKQLPLEQYDRPPRLVALIERRRQRKRIGRSKARRKCRYCGRAMSKKVAEVDHIIPKSRGGTDDPRNLVLCCRECNLSKGNKTVIEWVRSILPVARPERLVLYRVTNGQKVYSTTLSRSEAEGYALGLNSVYDISDVPVTVEAIDVMVVEGGDK